jgi:ABC-type glycerol-3-phosphate transport system substrate-binding protein
MLKKNKVVGILLMLLLLTTINVWALGRVDVKGLDIVIGNWWADYDVKTYQPQNDAAERTLAWRTKIQRDHGFTMSERNIAGWGEMQQLAVTSIMAGKPAAQVFVLQPDWAMALKKQDLLYPVSDIKNNNLTSPQPVERGQIAPRWNPNSIKDFTINNKIYAFSEGVNLTNAQVVFFNKRLFREAGIDPNFPYDQQKAGTWTWAVFLDMCKKLTRDINNDGIIDTYALPRDLSTDILDAILSSNGATYVDKDPRTGRFVNATNRPEFMEGLQFAIRLNTEGVMKPRPENTNWDWYKAEFADGNVAMRIDESYVWGELQNMRDDWGVVLFPKGPRSSNYRIFTRENILAIPRSYDEKMAEKIMYALQLWYTPVTDDWKSSMYNTFRDSRAVDETVALIRDTSLHMPKHYVFISGLNRGGIAWEMWYHEGDPAQLIEAVSSDWNAKIADTNEDIFGR